MKTTLILLFTSCIFCVTAQEKQREIRIGLFTSLYLDQYFNASGELYNQQEFPKKALSGVEFYEGVSLAVDSLNTKGIAARLKVYDVQSLQGNISQAVENGAFERLDLIIAHLGANDFLQLAVIAQEMNIPLINATYPNTKGITASPLVYIANPTINAHLTTIQKKLTYSWRKANIVWISKMNEPEKRLENIFKTINSSAGLNSVPYKTINLKDNFTRDDLIRQMDSTKNNVFILGSLDDPFCIKVTEAINTLSTINEVHLIGMPNLDGLKELQSRQFAGLPIYFTTAFQMPGENAFVRHMDDQFRLEMGIRCPPLVLKGFELTYYFCSILDQKGKIEIGHPHEKSFKVMTDFDFKPVYLKADSKTADYFENKNILFMRRLNLATLPYR
jgi:hypothetical protein